jgi:8-oxo-dGTP pyrophosphatase MutT (NUDIX family)
MCMLPILPSPKAVPSVAPGPGYGSSVTIYGFRRRVVCYLTRTTDHGEELLLFEHTADDAAHPSGVQVPAGTMMPFESVVDAALREVEEETGLTGLSYVDQVGATERSLNDPGGPSLTNFVHLVTSAPTVPGEGGELQQWEHTVTGDGEDAGMVFRCRWEPLPLSVVLADGQGAFLDRIGT